MYANWGDPGDPEHVGPGLRHHHGPDPARRQHFGHFGDGGFVGRILDGESLAFALDEGDVLAMQELPILAGETLSSLHDRLSQAGGPFLVKTIADFAEGRLKPKPQDHSRATYTQKITSELARLRWHEKSVRELDRQVRAMFPAPGAWFDIDGERWKVGAAERTTISGEPGLIVHADLDKGFLVGCRDGSCLKLLRLQRPGKGYVDTPDFLRGLHQNLAGRSLT